MANYKRSVLYMYEYDHDIKKGNLGYSRVESNPEQCKIVVHISKANWSSRRFKVYLFQRDSIAYKFSYLGELMMDNGVGELKIKIQMDDINHDGIEIEHFSGIVITDMTNTYIAGDLDQKGLQYRYIREIDQSEGRKIEEEKTTIEETKDTDEKQIADQLDGLEVKEETEQPKIELISKEQIETITETIENDSDNENKQKVEENINHSGERPESNDEWVVQLAKNLQTIFNATEPYYNPGKEDDSRDTEIREGTNEEVELCTASLQSCCSAEEMCDNDIEYRNIKCSIEESKSNKDCIDYNLHPCAKNILRRFPRIYPFEDNEICDCVRIEPQDIGLLPIEAWVLGNNSFLLHGYYSYHHLLFGKMKREDQNIYVIGVPGIFQNRERFMARMFGFNDFKCAKSKQPQVNEFGYWYLPIMLD